MFSPLHAGILSYDIRAFRWRAPLLSSPFLCIPRFSPQLHGGARLDASPFLLLLLLRGGGGGGGGRGGPREAGGGGENTPHAGIRMERRRRRRVVFSLTGFFLLLLLRHPHALSQRRGKREDTNLKTTAVQSFYSFSPLLPTPSSSVPSPPFASSFFCPQSSSSSQAHREGEKE